MPGNYNDYLDELFIDKLHYEPSFTAIAKPAIDGIENVISLSRNYVHGNVSVIVAECKDKLPVFQKALIKAFKNTYPDAHFLFISNGGKVFDLYNYATSKKLKAITYNEIDRNTRLFKEKVQFFNATSADGSADLKVQIDKAYATNDKITKKFYDQFKGIHDKLKGGIKGIKDDHDRAWYATTLLNRLMFIFFLQKNGVLQGDPEFLLTKYSAVKKAKKDYFKDFLLPLFFKGFARKDTDPVKVQFTDEFGPVKYLNGGLFYPNKIEIEFAQLTEETVGRAKVQVMDATNPAITISGPVLLEVITFLNGYTWYLDNRPAKDDKEINPDVLGYIFEKYINQKELGAYYTKEDITEYISKSTIIPFIFDKLRAADYDAPDPTTIITANGDITGIAEQWIGECTDFKALKFLYTEVLQPLSVLDPSVGSGAFLFAALNILLPIYQATVARLKTFKGGKDAWLTAFLKTLAEHPEEYFLTKQIILHNLYGVDIVEEAVEICKLRLFLQLAAHLADIQTMEPLPDIDFNIYAGNSLVGGLSYNDLRGTYGMQLFRKDGTALKESELLANIKALQSAKQSYKQAQGGDDEAVLKKGKEEIQRLENWINNAIDIGIDNPFHWFVDFAEIFERGGFDVVAGNPPYVEYSKVKNEYQIHGYRTTETGDLYSYLIERSLRIMNDSSYIGMIIPISMTSTDGFKLTRKIIAESCGASWVSHYAMRPGKLFDGVDKHLTIWIAHKKESNEKMQTYSSKYNRWFSHDRPNLFPSLAYTPVPESLFYLDSIPKIGSNLEQSILKKILRHKTIGSITDSNQSHILYHTRKLRYFVQFIDTPPKIFDSTNTLKATSELKEFRFSTALDRDVALAAYTSSLFFWYYIALSDCRNLNKREVYNFPLDIEKMPLQLKKELSVLSKSLMKNLQANSVLKTMNYKKHGSMTVQVFAPRLSKPILDQIDKHLGTFYGFTKQETDFILNYDIDFRLGSEDE